MAEDNQKEVSLELQVGHDIDEDEKQVNLQPIDSHKVSNWKAVFLIFRSLVGIGVLMMPHTIQRFGINGALVAFFLFGWILLYIIDLLIRVAKDLGFNEGK